MTLSDQRQQKDTTYYLLGDVLQKKPVDSENWLTQSKDKITQDLEVKNCVMAESAGFQMIAKARPDSETLVNISEGK